MCQFDMVPVVRISDVPETKPIRAWKVLAHAHRRNEFSSPYQHNIWDGGALSAYEPPTPEPSWVTTSGGHGIYAFTNREAAETYAATVAARPYYGDNEVVEVELWGRVIEHKFPRLTPIAWVREKLRHHDVIDKARAKMNATMEGYRAEHARIVSSDPPDTLDTSA